MSLVCPSQIMCVEAVDAANGFNEKGAAAEESKAEWFTATPAPAVAPAAPPEAEAAPGAGTTKEHSLIPAQHHPQPCRLLFNSCKFL